MFDVETKNSIKEIENDIDLVSSISTYEYFLLTEINNCIYNIRQQINYILKDINKGKQL